MAEAIEEAQLSAAAAKAAERGLGDVEDALAPDAYWRAKTWKRVAVIFAGPGANLLLAVILFALLFMVGGGKATRTVDEVVADTPAAAMGLQSGDEIVAIGETPVDADEIARLISSSNGRPLTVTVERNGRTGRARADQAEGDRRRVPPGLRACGRGARAGRLDLAGDPRDRDRDEGDRRLGGPARHGRRAQGDLEPGRHRAGLVSRRSSRATTRTSGCWG